MFRFYSSLSLVYFVLATASLVLLALALLGMALWNVVIALPTPQRVEVVLDSAGIMIIGFAIIETAKFIAEEEIVRRRELRSPSESRRSLTKFVTIIVIAASLEALVMVFKTGRDDIALTIYPAVLFAAAMLALVSLGAYQWLSSRIAPPSAREQAEDRAAAKRQQKLEDGQDPAPDSKGSR